jgi:hypothetical protein
MTFRTIAKLRRFLRENGTEFRGIWEGPYTLADGRIVRIIDRSTANTWGIHNEMTEVEVLT